MTRRVIPSVLAIVLALVALQPPLAAQDGALATRLASAVAPDALSPPARPIVSAAAASFDWQDSTIELERSVGLSNSGVTGRSPTRVDSAENLQNWLVICLLGLAFTAGLIITVSALRPAAALRVPQRIF